MSLIPQEWKTGLNVATQVDNIAQQITIRIDSKNGVEGSGVIIGKQGDIYSVLTACHVVSDPYCQSGKIKDNYTLVTPDGATYRLTSKNMLLTQGLDAALLKFSSQKSYQVATLARYKIPILRKQLIFVSGFPGELKGVRKLTGGYRFHRDKGLNLAFDRLKLEVDTSGYELLYTNLTQPGMSGGPVFDSKGQVIGINTGQEGEIVSSTEQRNLGFSFGVPTIKLLAFAEQKGLDLSTLAISQQVPETLTDNDLKNVQKHPTFILENPPKDGSANSWLNYGNQLWRLKQTEQAIAAFQKAIKLNPNFGEAYYGLGLSYFQQGKIGEKDETDPKAVAAFEQAIALNPYFKQAWTQKSYALQDLGKYEEALAAIEQGIKISSDDFKLYNQRASILKDLSRYSEAKQAYTKSLENYPLGVTYFHRGHLHLQLGELDQAFQDFTKSIEKGLIEAYSPRAIINLLLNNKEAALADCNQALKFEPQNADNYLVRSFIYMFLKNYPQALADVTKAIDLENKNDLLYFQRGLYYSLNNQDKLALQDLNQALELNPDQVDYYKFSGLLKLNLKDYEGALKDYTQAITLNRDDGDSYQGRARAYWALNNQEEAIEDYSVFMKLNPNLYSYVERGSWRQQIKDYQGAIADFSSFIQQKPDQPGGYIFRGGVYRDLQDYSQAINDYNKAIEIAPNNTRAYVERSHIYRRLNNYSAAMKDVNKIIELMPNKPLGYQTRGSIHYAQNNYEKALADYQLALSKDQNLLYAPITLANIGIIKYEQGDIQKAIQLWQQAVNIREDLDSDISVHEVGRANASKLALATAFYSAGQSEKALFLAKEALRTDRRLEDISYLQDNLWGQQMVKDWTNLLKNPQIKAFLAQRADK